jgi:hypothetical protein
MTVTGAGVRGADEVPVFVVLVKGGISFDDDAPVFSGIAMVEVLPEL